MEYLVENGVPFGENGISRTNSRKRKNYYLCMSFRNTKLHEKYNKMIMSK